MALESAGAVKIAFQKGMRMKVTTVDLQVHGDERGSLVALEDQKNIPFAIRRVYYLFATKPGVRRGMHAHRNLQQLVVAVRGSCHFLLDDGKERIKLLLDDPEKGLLVDSMVWREMYDFSTDCVLMVLASAHYDANDYIRDYDQFRREIDAEANR